jgi:hypothetical protein
VCSEASAAMGAVAAYCFLNGWNLKVSPDKSVQHIPRCVYCHAQGLRLEALQDLDVGSGGRAPQLDTVSPERFEDGFVQKQFVA